MFKFIISLFALILLVGEVNAFESSFYTKGGIVKPPGKERGVLPQVGIGARFQKGCHGCDLSVSGASLFFFNYLNPKVVYLYYPKPQNNSRFYVGTGLGYGLFLSEVPMGGPYGSSSKIENWITSESVIGCEFRTNKQVKPFVQLDISQNLFSLKHHSPRGGIGIGLTCGLRF